MVQLETYPSRICGGVYIDGSDGKPAGFVPVELAGNYLDEDRQYALWEYKVAGGHPRAGEIRACLLYVPQGTMTGWQIHQTADPTYYEVHTTVSGHGHFKHDSPQAGGFEAALPQTPLDARELPLVVRVGESFTIESEPDYHNRVLGGIAVLAVFPGAAFQPEYETNIYE